MDIIDKIALGESIEPSNEERLSKVSEELGVNPEWVSSAIQFESKWDPNATNPLSGAKGLIQFTNTTAKELGYENAEDLAKKHPTIESQISGPVKDYLKKKGPFKDERDFYLSIFYPAGRNLPDDTKLPDNVRKLNPGINTVGDYVKLVKDSVASGDLNISDVEPGQGDVLDKMLFPDLFDDFEYSEYGELLPQPQAQQQMDQPVFQGGKAEPSKASGPLDFESKYAIPFQEEPAVSTNVPLSDEYKLKPLSESSPASVLGKKYRLNEDVQSGVLSQAKDPVAYEKEIKSGREIPSGRKKGITEIGGINALISGGRDVDTRVNANVDEFFRSTMFQSPDALTEQRMKDYPEVMGSMIAGQVVPAFAGGAGLQKTLLGIPQVARLASAGKWGKTAFSAVTRSVASGTDFAIRSKEELTSTDPVVQKKAIGRLATVIAASAASPLPEEFLPKGYIQPFAQAAADLVVQVAGDKYIGEDSFSEENIVNTIAGTITSGLFALNDIRKPNVAPKAKPEVTSEAKPEVDADFVRPDTKPDVDFEFKPEEPAVKAEQKPKPEVPKTETVETPDIDKADVPRVQTDTEPFQRKAVPASSKTEPEVSPSEIPEDAIPLPSKDDPSYFEVPEAGPARGSVRIGPG
ncbi:MAG: transglycosylase SLT domain-containing protein, partial [Candidatus Omnitrophota bacterium]